jgi:opacity protein-like surface antigen
MFGVAGLAVCMGLLTSQEASGQVVSGYVQGQYQWGEADAKLQVGAANGVPGESFSRWGVRRARLRVSHEKGLVSGAMEVDATEKGLTVKDVYLNARDPWLGWCRLQAGIFTCPFGYELTYSTPRLESPERSLLCRTLFPDEKDLGVMLRIEPDVASAWHFLRFAGGWFAGNGVKPEIDNRRDFIGSLSAERWLGSRIRLAGGLSYCNGSVYQGTDRTYSMTGDGFVASAGLNVRGRFSRREYLGVDAEWSVLTPSTGRLLLRSQYVFGRQPGSADGSKSLSVSALPDHDVYNRDFAGGHVLLVQELERWPLSLVLKYDWYDPNTQIAGNELGRKAATGVGDLAFGRYGGGLLWQVTVDMRVQAYYEVNRNETSDALPAYANDWRDNVFTLRLQYRF